MEELRLYTFCNMYLSSIQNGIQSLHVTSELFTKYADFLRVQDEMMRNWAREHKTVVVLNGGDGAELHKIRDFFNHPDNLFPHSYFTESKDALDGALTSVGIILPERIFLTAKFIREGTFDTEQAHPTTHEIILETGQLRVPDGYHSGTGDVVWEFTKWELKLATRLNNYSLAR